MIRHILGLDDANGVFYLFWSGIGADLGMFAAGFVWYRHKMCHYPACHRIGRYPMASKPWVMCKRHRPHVD